MANDTETIGDISAELRDKCATHYCCEEARRKDGEYPEGFEVIDTSELANRIDAAVNRERELLRSCARWILTHDIYGHMAQELLAECKKVLGDDGKFLITK